MKKVNFTYRMRISFTNDVCEHRFTLKCLPGKGVRQLPERLEYHVAPASFVEESTDSFGNRYLYGCVHETHREFNVEIKGSALCGVQTSEPAGPEYRLGIYRAPTALTRIGPELKRFIETLSADPKENERGYIRELLDEMKRQLIYQRWHTNSLTTAEEAFAGGFGVCQDYVHIFLACLRAKGIACRYAAGLVPGEGETHAWADVLIDGEWVGFDPTNDCPAGDNYLALCYGRDAADCGVNKGIFFGNAQQSVEVNASLFEDDEQ